MLGCMACGGMMSDILDSLRHHRFWRFYAAHPVQFWLTIPINLVVVYLLARGLRQISQQRRDPAIRQEKAGVGPSPVGVKFYTTPFIRICVYAGFYILGICLVFFSDVSTSAQINTHRHGSEGVAKSSLGEEGVEGKRHLRQGGAS